MPFSDTEEGHDHSQCRRVARARWFTILILLLIMLLNGVFCLWRIAINEQQTLDTRRFWEDHVRYVMSRDATWEPMIKDTADLVRMIREAEKIKAIARAKVDAERAAAKGEKPSR
jgi:hypothetical protein